MADDIVLNGAEVDIVCDLALAKGQDTYTLADLRKILIGLDVGDQVADDLVCAVQEGRLSLSGDENVLDTLVANAESFNSRKDDQFGILKRSLDHMFDFFLSSGQERPLTFTSQGKYSFEGYIRKQKKFMDVSDYLARKQNIKVDVSLNKKGYTRTSWWMRRAILRVVAFRVYNKSKSFRIFDLAITGRRTNLGRKVSDLKYDIFLPGGFFNDLPLIEAKGFRKWNTLKEVLERGNEETYLDNQLQYLSLLAAGDSAYARNAQNLLKLLSEIPSLYARNLGKSCDFFKELNS